MKIGSQLLGGANTKVGQGASLLDAMTNQQIMDYGAEMQRWASGKADSNAMAAGQGNQQTAMGKYQTDVNAATSRANAAMSAASGRANAAAADTNKYMALVGAASGMYGDSRGYGTLVVCAVEQQIHLAMPIPQALPIKSYQWALLITSSNTIKPLLTDGIQPTSLIRCSLENGLLV